MFRANYQLSAIMLLTLAPASCSSSDTPHSAVTKGAPASADLGIATAIIKTGTSMLAASAQNNVETGSAIIRVFIDRKVDAIVMDPFDAAAFVPLILSANTADIPVVSYDQVPVGGKVIGAFVSDNKQRGAGTAELALQAGQAVG